jgi:RNA polymerase sigma factor (sigma-70 family)
LKTLEKEFLHVIRDNERIILKVCNIYCRKQIDREDLYQDILVQLWKSFPTFRNKSKVSTWLYRIALNTAITRYRKIKRMPETQAHDESVNMIASPDNSGEEENINLLNHAIEGLNKVEKAITLLYLEDATYKEIAEIIGISETNVGFRINQIKQKLFNKLKINK